MTSVLESEFMELTRPYSQNELQDMRKKLSRNMRLGKTVARHHRCSHFYSVKHNGRKDKEICESGSEDSGHCSVCWKLSKTSRHLSDKAQDLVYNYTKEFKVEPKYLTYDLIDLESVYYKWLEINPCCSTFVCCLSWGSDCIARAGAES